MALRLLILVIIIVISGSVIAQKKKINVLSYYAVNNTIDGQPKIDQINVLRFYPVFAFRNKTREVKFTVYYGGEVYRREAIKMGEGLYWEAKLPEFDLGESIQRYEVETKISLMSYVKFRNELDSIRNGFQELNVQVKSYTQTYTELKPRILVYESLFLKINSELQKQRGVIDTLLSLYPDSNRLEVIFKDYKSKLEEITFFKNDMNNVLDSLEQLNNTDFLAETYLRVYTSRMDTFLINITDFDLLIKSHKKSMDTLVLSLGNLDLIQSEFELLKERIGDSENRDSIALDLSTIFEKNNKILGSLAREVTNVHKAINAIPVLQSDFDNTVVQLVDKKIELADTVKKSLMQELIDKEFSGIGIQNSDIVLDEDSLQWAKILYRNYKLKNRDLPALDPAEELGVFRLRYIPFPVVGNELVGPVRSGFPIIFEAGITFGNRVVVSNELFDPAFSVRKLGVAIAFTHKFFDEDAEILALAFTYDFNTYASIGVGANFGTLARDTPDPYFSLGINQKVFQALSQGLKSIFNKPD